MQKELLCMATEAKLRGNRKYLSKCKEFKKRYSEKEMSEYNRLKTFLSENDTSLAGYVKNLIKADLDKRGY